MAFGPLLKQLMSQAARNPQVQKAIKAAAANVINNPQLRQGFTNVRMSARRAVDTVTGRNKPPGTSGPGSKSTSQSSSSSGSAAGGSKAGGTRSPFADMYAFWEKHKTAIASFVAANFMGILLLLQVSNGLWPVLKQALFGHPHEQQKRKKIKEKEAASAAAAAAAPGANTNNDLGQTHHSDEEDGMTYYNMTEAETVNAAANPAHGRNAQRPSKKQKKQEQHANEALDDVAMEASFSAPAAPSALVVEAEAPLSTSAEEIFAHSKANSGAVSTFDNSFHYKVGDVDNYQSSVESISISGRDAREATGARKGGSWLGFFRRNDDPLGRARGVSSDSGEQTLVFDMRSTGTDH